MNRFRWSRAMVCVCVSLLVGASDGVAYELRTHERITGSAIDLSQGVRAYLEDMGIDRRDVFDFSGRTPANQLALFENTGTPRDWMIEGAIREDDFRPHLECDQPLNPASSIDRPLNHFFDVQRGGQGLTVLGLQRGLPAPDWALGMQGRGTEATQNQFSVLDARIYQLRSMTEASRTERDRNTARLFRTLGHVTHILEDMAQPQHTRNDAHAGCIPEFLTGEHSWLEDYMETRVRGQRFRARGLPSPPPLLDGYSPVAFQAYRDYWANPTLSGLADFSSRNFLSAGTNLGFDHCGGLPEPPCNPDAYGSRDVSVSGLTLSGVTLAGTVRLFTRSFQDPVTAAMVTTRDPVTGLITEDVALTSRSLWDQHLESRGFLPTFSLNTLNYDSIGDVLLPRAVGYSAGFLDYFFRGKLDVDLIEADPNDPSVVRLSGTNASPDVLDGGTLTLYADDPADGVRREATALDQDLSVTAAKDAPVESARFQVPGGGERFVAVYKGTLGLEKQEGSFPGGVIGKVLGGVRVEEIFADGERWKLRTPKGVFLLQGLTVAGFEEVRWGDGDNILVARTPFGPIDADQPNRNRVVAYEVQRVPGSAEPATVDTPDGPEVRLTKKNEATFPFGMPLETTVNFSQTLQYRQRLARVERHRTLLQWVPRFPFRPQDGTYEFAGEELGTLTAETASVEAVRFSESFPIALDLERHGLFGTVDRPYVWHVQEVAADASGRLLGVVVVHLTSPQSPGTTLPFFGVNQQGGHEVVSRASFTPFFPSGVNPLLWAIVDLKTRAVVASTGDRLITLTSQAISDALPDLYVHGSLEFLGGPTPDVQEIPWNKSSFGLVDPSRPTVVDAELETRAGGLGIGVTGWLKGELASLGLFDFQLGTLQRADEFTYDCGADAARNFFCRAVQVLSSTGVVTRGPARLEDARRSRPAPGDERLVFIKVGPDGEGPQDTVLVWEPSAQSARMVHRLPVAGESAHLLGPATGAAAMVVLAGGEPFHLVPLEGGGAPTFFPSGATSITLLHPRFLYHVRDLRFYRPRPPLQPTALPARLADVPGNPLGDYHAIRLP